MGAGIHGGFGGTKGAEGHMAPVTAVKDVRYSKKKTEEYLLNPNHPVGGAKAKFMRDVLGYSQADSHLFHKNVAKSLVGKTPFRTEITPYGTKHTYRIQIIGKNGGAASAKVVVVIQKDNGRITYKIVTIYPDKKEG